MKASLRQSISNGVVMAGITAMGRLVGGRDGAFILYGHRVAHGTEGFLEGLKPSWFEDQLRYLTRHYEVIPFGTLVECFESRRKVPPRSVVLTFDDGFKDNYETVVPLLERFAVPATFFVVTGCLSSGQLPWSQRLGVGFEKTACAHVTHSPTGLHERSLLSLDDRRAAYGVAKSAIAPWPRAERDRAIDEILENLSVVPPRDHMMSWSQAAEMMAKGHEIGAHTYSHALLGRVTKAEARWEMARSRDDLRNRLGLTSPHFCFPGGSLDPSLVAEARTLGFRSTFLPRQARRLNQIDTTDAFGLSRVGLPNADARVLEAELDGPFQTLRTFFGARRQRLRS